MTKTKFVKHTALVIVTSVIGFALSACGGSAEQAGPTATPSSSRSSVTPSPTPSASKSAATASPTPSATPTRKTIDNATKDKPFVSGVGLPKGFPKSVPLPTTGEIKTGSSTMEGWTIEFSGVSAREVEALRGNIKSAGGSEIYAIPGADLATAAYEMTGYSLQLMWMPNAKGKETSFVYTVSKRSA